MDENRPPDGFESDAPPDGFEPSTLDNLKQAALSAGKKLLPGALETAEPYSSFRQAPDLIARSRNFVMGQPNQPAETPMQAMANRPDLMATAASTMIPGVGLGPAAARIAGTAGSAALNPETRSIKDAGIVGGLQTALELLTPAAGLAGKIAKPFFAKLSQTEAKGVQALVDHPAMLFTGPSKEEAQAIYAAAAQKAGLSPEVSDKVLFESRKKFLRNVTEALAEGKEVPTQSLLDARSVGHDLVAKAARQGEKNLSRGYYQRVERIQAQLAKQAPELREADKVYSAMKTREQFMNILPRNKAGEYSINFPSLAAGIVSGGKALIGSSPAAVGLGAAATGAIMKAKRPLQTGLQTIRQYLQGQMQNGPASR